MNGLTAKNLRLMREHYIRLAIRMRRLRKEIPSSASAFRDSQNDYRRVASEFKKFWPVVFGVAL